MFCSPWPLTFFFLCLSHPSGFPGPRGIPGPEAPPGEKGVTGQYGGPGYPGRKGLKGDYGSPGYRGQSGVPGKKGMKTTSWTFLLNRKTLNCRFDRDGMSLWNVGKSMNIKVAIQLKIWDIFSTHTHTYNCITCIISAHYRDVFAFVYQGWKVNKGWWEYPVEMVTKEPEDQLVRKEIPDSQVNSIIACHMTQPLRREIPHSLKVAFPILCKCPLFCHFAAGVPGQPGSQGPLPLPITIPAERGAPGHHGIRGPEGKSGEPGPQGPPGDAGQPF